MHAGLLDQRVIVKRKVATRDDMGGEVFVWVSDPPRWMNARPVAGREYVALAQQESDIEVVFTGRYLSCHNIPTDARLEWRNTDYELKSPPIDVAAKKQWCELVCRTAQNA